MSTKEYDISTGKVIDTERRKAVMCLESEKDIETLASVLRQRRYRILGQTQDLKVAQELVRKHKTGIFFLDKDIAQGKELEILADTKRRFPGFDVVLLSSKVTPDMLEDAFQKGVAGYLIKPIKNEDAMKIMQRIGI